MLIEPTTCSPAFGVSACHPSDDLNAALRNEVNLFTHTRGTIVPDAVADRVLDSLGYPSTDN